MQQPDQNKLDAFLSKMVGDLGSVATGALVVLGDRVAFLRLTAPIPVSSSELGSNWKCNKTAFVLTTCTQIR